MYTVPFSALFGTRYTQYTLKTGLQFGIAYKNVFVSIQTFDTCGKLRSCIIALFVVGKFQHRIMTARKQILQIHYERRHSSTIVIISSTESVVEISIPVIASTVISPSKYISTPSSAKNLSFYLQIPQCCPHSRTHPGCNGGCRPHGSLP